MKTKRVMACLVAGVCILSVSVVAAFGSVNGYANYKTAVKALALNVDNVSAQGTFSMSYDGATVMNGQGEFAKDGADTSAHMVVTDVYTGQKNEHWNTICDGTEIWMDQDAPYYQTYEHSTDEADIGHGLLGFTEDDEFSARFVNLMEMGVDTVMGDLKNNVIEIASSNGDYTYQLDINKGQVPAVVNAALSLLAYSVSESTANTAYVDWEEWDKCAISYYEQETGQTLSEDFMSHYNGVIEDDSWWEDNEELEAFEDAQSEMHEHYYQQLEQKIAATGSTGGILYVAADGSTTFYDDVKEYQKAHGEADMDDIEDFIGQDLSLETVHFVFSVDKSGNLTSNHCEATFLTVDEDGQTHTMVLTGDATLGDYGTTVIQPLDVGDRLSYEEYQNQVGF